MEMTKAQKIKLIEEIVPDLILESAMGYEWFSEDKRAINDIKSFNGDRFKEYIDNKFENNKYILEKKDTFEGYEGAGEEMWVVYSLTSKVDNSIVYFKMNGWYNSWDSNEWEGIDIVEPKEVKKIEWENI